MKDNEALRAQIAHLLDWHEAHAGFDDAVEGLPAKLRGVIPEGLPYSAWQLVEHIRRAQADILDFCVNPNYVERKWPEDYWPEEAAAPSPADWNESIAAFRKDREELKRLCADPDVDLFAPIPHGSGQTYLREFLLVADHTAYHVGQLIAVRRLLDAWKKG
jgi:hypothetical protein